MAEAIRCAFRYDEKNRESVKFCIEGICPNFAANQSIQSRVSQETNESGGREAALLERDLVSRSTELRQAVCVPSVPRFVVYEIDTENPANSEKHIIFK